MKTVIIDNLVITYETEMATAFDGYRYGFNGQEKDNEVYGDANSYTAEYWQYDPRTGRRWNVDPVVKEWESPYATFNNSPILMSDPNGDDPTEPEGPCKTCPEAGVEGQRYMDPFPIENYDVNGYRKDLTAYKAYRYHTGSKNVAAGWYEESQYNQHTSESFDSWFAGGHNLDGVTYAQYTGMSQNAVDNADPHFYELGTEQSVVVKPGGDFIVINDRTVGQIYMAGGAGGIQPADFEFYTTVVPIGGGLLKLSAMGVRALVTRGALFSLRGGNGVFGANGLRLGGYRLDMLYRNPSVGQGAGTIFSLRQTQAGGALLRWDYGVLHTTRQMGLHSSIRFYWNGVKYGSSAQRTWYPSTFQAPFFRPIR